MAKIRIIGGDWRGRKLQFYDAEGLRPTPDRVRETLFNWLASAMPGARCLDLFAGSDALGFEAASRGAAQVVMVEAAPATAQQLIRQAEALGAGAGAAIVNRSAEDYLRQPPEPFDIVLLDPPFAAGLLQPVLAQLAGGWLHESSYLYVEAERSLAAETMKPWLPPGFDWYRVKQAGDVGYQLARHV